MGSVRPKPLRIGDILEISTYRGLAYAQYTYKHPRFGYLVRVLPGFYNSRPANLTEIISGPERYFTFVFLRQALRRDIVRVIGRHEVPERARKFPLFRDGVVDPKTGRVAHWWLWDGEREWRVGKLTKREKNLPIRSVWNDILLAERIASEWSPADVV